MGDSVRRLKFGDARIEIIDKTGVLRALTAERKTVSDLIGSLESGRLNQQLSGCDMLIIVDQKDMWLPRGMWDRLYKDEQLRLITNSIQRHSIVQYVTSISEYFSLLRTLERQLEHGEFGVLTLRRKVDRSLDNQQTGALACYPGIGHKIAAKILGVYGSLKKANDNIATWDKDVEQISKDRRDKATRFYEEDTREKP